MRLDSALKEVVPNISRPKKSRHFLMKLSDNFQMSEHSWPCRFHITTDVKLRTVFCVVFCKSLFVLWSFFFWSLYCVDCPPTIYGFLSPFCLCIVSTVLLRFTASYLPLIFVLCRLSYDLRLLISLWSLYCVDCPPTIYGFLSPFGIIHTLLFS
jgi:hypothetical protein